MRTVDPIRVKERDSKAARGGCKLEFSDGCEHTVDGVHPRAREGGGVVQRTATTGEYASLFTLMRRQTQPLEYELAQRDQQKFKRCSYACRNSVSKVRSEKSRCTH
eukprot:2878617-Pleurochrysis_carterae.AAC.1